MRFLIAAVMLCGCGPSLDGTWSGNGAADISGLKRAWQVSLVISGASVTGQMDGHEVTGSLADSRASLTYAWANGDPWQLTGMISLVGGDAAASLQGQLDIHDNPRAPRLGTVDLSLKR